MKKLDRRKFISQSAWAISALGFSKLLGKEALLAGNTKPKLTILHTNDLHSRIDPFPKQTPKFGNQGGLLRLASAVAAIRKIENNVLLLDCGDVFQGTPYFNYFGGELEYTLMNEMGYDATTLGNHEFDNGIVGLYKQMPKAKFQFLNCNYDVKNTSLSEYVKPYQIFEKNGLKIGVIGAGVDLQGLVNPQLCADVHYLDPIDSVCGIAQDLKENLHCDLVILISHLGFEYADNAFKVSDVVLAAQSQYIDLILGGHTHTFLEEPVVVQNLKGQPVCIHQVGWAGLRLGHIEVSWNNALAQYTFSGKSINVF
jgi:5'-nucleotidase